MCSDIHLTGGALLFVSIYVYVTSSSDETKGVKLKQRL